MRKRPGGRPHESEFASLAAEGIDGTTLASGCLPAQRLSEILAAGTDASFALAKLLGEVPRPEHGALLAAANDTSHGALRREVRRALYRLRQAGIVPPAQTTPREPRAAARADTPSETEGWLSHVDGSGDQLVWITKPAGRALFSVSARINDRDGLWELAAVETSKRQFRAQRDGLRDRHGLRLVPVDWRHADALIAAAHARSAPKSGPSYPRLRTRFTTDPCVPLEPPIYRQIPRDAVATELVDVSADLLDAPELRSWLPTPSVLEPYAREILDSRDSPLVLSRHQQGDRLRSIIDRAVRDVYPAEVFAPRLEAMAFYFWQTARERHARIALAAAHALVVGTPANAVPLLSALLRQGLSPVYETANVAHQEQERGSLIVKPTAPQPGSGARRQHRPRTGR